MTEESAFSKSMIIIGAGLAGLSTGCYAQMNGYQTRIFEQHTRAGGVCTSWKRKGYTIDGCLHWLVGGKPGSPLNQIYQEVGALDGNRVIALDHLARFVQEDDGQSLEITADLDRLAADMKALSPSDEQAIDKLCQAIRASKAFDLRVDKPSEMLGPLNGLKQVWAARHQLRYAIRYNMSATTFAERIQSPFLSWVLSNLIQPETPMILVLILLAQLAAGNVATVEGGSLEFALAIVRRYRELGGQVIYGASVEKILVEDGQAVGIRLADGSEHRARVVVSAADGYSTLFDMLDRQYVGARLQRRYRTWPLSRPILLASYGIDRPLAGWPAENIIKLHQPLDIAGQQIEKLRCQMFRDPTLAAQGKTVIQATIESKFDYWQDLSKDRARYEAEKERIAAQVLERLQSHFPGVGAQIEMTDVATPHAFWRYTRNRHAACRGWLATPRHTHNVLFYPLPKTVPGLSNFYMAGQWVEPRGTVPAALLSGRQVVQALCHSERMPFLTAVP